MNAIKTIACALCAFFLASCGYHLGGLKNSRVKDVNTCCVHMFGNLSFYPLAAMQMTSALTDALQCDGTFSLTSPKEADMSIEGEISNVSLSSVRTNIYDTYVSDEVRLTVAVSYRAVRSDNGEKLASGVVHESVTCFLELGNVESGKEDAVSYAVRKAADRIVERLTTP